MKSYTIIFVLLTILIFRSVSGGDEIPHKENPTWLSHLPQDVQKAVLWYADHEEGSLHDWKYDDLENSGGGIFNTGSPNEAIARTISDVSFSGEYSVQATIRNAYRCKYGSKAVHLMRWTDRPWDKNGNYFPKKAYYSTWMVIPKNYNPNKEPPWDPGDGGWWNIFQFKSDDKEGESRPIWVLNIGHDAQTESMIFYLYTKYNQPHSHKAQSQIPIPVGKWFHVEALNEKSKPYRKNGNIKIWFNGIVLFDIPHVVTSLSEHTSWGLGNYTDYIDGGTTPGTATIYFDDALVSTAPPHAHAKLFLETE